MSFTYIQDTTTSGHPHSVVVYDTVVQDPFTFAKRIDANFWDAPTRPTAPLLHVAVTSFVQTGEWSISTSSAHIVGDGGSVYGFLHTLNRAYLGLEPDPTAKVVYDRPAWPGSDGDVDTREAEGEFEMPWLDVVHPLGTQPPHKHSTPTTRLDFKMTKDQVAQLKRGVISRGVAEGVDGIERISAQDALAATLAASVTLAAPDAPPIRTVTTHINVRPLSPLYHFASLTF
jgi:hypothetical protein